MRASAIAHAVGVLAGAAIFACSTGSSAATYNAPSVATVKVDRKKFRLEFAWSPERPPNFPAGIAVEFQISISPKCFTQPPGGRDDSMLVTGKTNLPPAGDLYRDVWNYWQPDRAGINKAFSERCGATKDVCLLPIPTFTENTGGNFAIGLRNASALRALCPSPKPAGPTSAAPCVDQPYYFEYELEEPGPDRRCYDNESKPYLGFTGEWADRGFAAVSMQHFANTCSIEGIGVTDTKCPELIGFAGALGGFVCGLNACNGPDAETAFWLNRLCVPTDLVSFTPKPLKNPGTKCIDHDHDGYFAIQSEVMFGSKVGDCDDNKSSVKNWGYSALTNRCEILCSTTETNCSDGIDGDCDGKIDCADEDCIGTAACSGAGCPGKPCTSGEWCNSAVSGTCFSCSTSPKPEELAWWKSACVKSCPSTLAAGSNAFYCAKNPELAGCYKGDGNDLLQHVSSGDYRFTQSCGAAGCVIEASGCPDHCASCTSAATCDDCNKCTTDSCVGGACTHAAVTCTTPPPPSCLSDGKTLRKPTSPGTCDPKAGCSYLGHTDTTCSFGCSGTTCVGDPCSGKVCNDSNPCTKDSCSGGVCSFMPDDSLSCGSGLICKSGACVAASTCTTGAKERCYVECRQTYASGCLHGGLPPLLPGVKTCAGGAWGACVTSDTCSNFVASCTNGTVKSTPFACLDGTTMTGGMGCSKPLGPSCTSAYYSSWPVAGSTCLPPCVDPCPSVGATRACEVTCDSPSGVVRTGSQKCNEFCSTLLWGPCFTDDGCLK